MVKLGEIPTSKPRYDLKKLKKVDFIDLHYMDEEYKEATTDDEGHKKTGGLVINYETRNDEILTQKYSKLFGKVLQDKCRNLDLASTEDMGKSWIKFEKIDVESTNTNAQPRLYPVEMLEQFEIDVLTKAPIKKK